MHYLGKYKSPMIGKMEQLPDSLIGILKQNNEDFDEKGIRENIYVHGANNKDTNKPISLAKTMTYEQIKKLLTQAEIKLHKDFDYHAF